MKSGGSDVGSASCSNMSSAFLADLRFVFMSLLADLSIRVLLVFVAALIFDAENKLTFEKEWRVCATRWLVTTTTYGYLQIISSGLRENRVRAVSNLNCLV